MPQARGLALGLSILLCGLGVTRLPAEDQVAPVLAVPPASAAPAVEAPLASPLKPSSECDGRSACACGGSVDSRLASLFDGDDRTGLFDNASLFMGLEGSKQPQEYGVNAHFGGRVAAELGVPLSEELGLGLQVGTSMNYTDNAVQVYERFGEATGRFQNFSTVGLFQRHDSGLVWGGAIDWLHQTYYDHGDLLQFRGRLGWQLNDQDQVGFLAALSDDSDRQRIVGIPVTLQPLNQGSVYFNRRWESQAETMIWLGLAESHGERNLAFEALLGDPQQRPSGERVVFGAEIHVPLNDHVALFGQGNFILPSDTGTVDSFLGLAVYPSGGAKQSRRSRYSPLLPVANSTTFSVDLR